MSWTRDSEFCRFVFEGTARACAPYGGKDDPVEALSEVWIGLDPKFREGQELDGTSIGLLRTIIVRRVRNYFKSHGVGWREQPGRSSFDDPAVENLKSPGLLPDHVAADRERCEFIAANLSELPPRRAEAIRSRFGYPDAPEWAALVQSSGTTRQNLSKLAEKGLEELRSRSAWTRRSPTRVGRVNPGV